MTTSEIEPTSFRLVARCQIHVLQYVINTISNFIFITQCVSLSTYSIIRLFSYPSSFRSRSLTDVWSFTVLNYSVLRTKSKFGFVSLHIKLINPADRYFLNSNDIASVKWDQNIFLEGNSWSQRVILTVQCSWEVKKVVITGYQPIRQICWRLLTVNHKLFLDPILMWGKEGSVVTQDCFSLDFTRGSHVTVQTEPRTIYVHLYVRM
jgi:hypothetical protein